MELATRRGARQFLLGLQARIRNGLSPYFLRAQRLEFR